MPEYALILLFLLIFTIWFQRHFRVLVWRNFSHFLLLYAVLLPVAVVWDHVALARGHWSFGDKYLLGIRLGLMPIEEYGFIFITSYFGLVLYRVIEKHLK